MYSRTCLFGSMKAQIILQRLLRRHAIVLSAVLTLQSLA
jgi:hypothetical protein